MSSSVSKTLTTCFSKGRLEKVEVQIFVKQGISKFDIIGLPQNMIREGRDRILTALHQVGLELSSRRIVASLNPGDIPKEGSHFDLPIVIGILKCLGLIQAAENNYYWGEIELNACIREFQNPLPHFMFAQSHKAQVLLSNTPDRYSDVVRKRLSACHLKVQHLTEFITGKYDLTGLTTFPSESLRIDDNLESWKNKKFKSISFSDLRASHTQVILMSLCAIGNHHLLMEGPPGVGKSLWPKLLAELRPPLNAIDWLEHCRTAQSAFDPQYFDKIPFVQPHHSSSMASIVGGGKAKVTAGAISRAHKGILFLDEFSEFSRSVIESLREPLENQSISIARSEDFQILPADIQLIASQNPCRCGGYQSGSQACRCSSVEFYRYQNKISAPIRDRFHWKVWWDFADEPITEFQNETEWKAKILKAKRFKIEKVLPIPQLQSLSARKQRIFLQKLESWAKYFEIKEITENDARDLIQFEEELSCPHPNF